MVRRRNASPVAGMETGGIQIQEKPRTELGVGRLRKAMLKWFDNEMITV